MTSGALSIMAPAFIECLILVGILSYLGLHVIKRKVIFVDLALAQIAALGATVGFLFGVDPASTPAFIFSLLFSFIGAAIFALTRLRNERVPQEAVIGLVYALAAAVSILVIDKSPHGAEHIKDLLTGTILWVKWSQIISSAAAFALVGLFHYILRHRFITITEDPDAAFQAGMWVRLWDFLFYLSFGLVITFAVRTAGVILVFVFLVAPAITAVMLTTRWLHQLLIGWVMGTMVTVAALYFSYILDIPTGPSVVALYGAVLLLVALAVFVLKSEQRTMAVAKLVLGILGTVVVAGCLWILGTVLGSSSAEHLEVTGGHGHDMHQASHPEAAGAGKEKPVSRQGDPQAWLKRLKKKVTSAAPGWKRELAETILDNNFPLLFKEEALELLRARAKSDFGYDPEGLDNSAAVKKMKAWGEASTIP